MEDGIGFEIFLRSCLSEKEFSTFIKDLDDILCNKKEFEKRCNSWATLHIGNAMESEEIYRLMHGECPQLFLTTKDAFFDDYGPVLDIGVINLRGSQQIREYIKKMADYAKKYHSYFAK